MANITPNTGFPAGITQIETSDDVIGGISGIANLHAKQLMGGIIYLKTITDLYQANNPGLISDVATLKLQVGSFKGTLNTTNSGQVPAAVDSGKIIVLNSYGVTFPANSTSGYVDGSIYRVISTNTFGLPLVIAKSSGQFVYKNALVSTIQVYAGDQFDVQYLGGTWYVFKIDSFGYSPIGTMIYWPHTNRPDEASSGWLNCDGRNSLLRNQYPELFAIVAAQWGAGSDGTTFKIPQSAGYLIRAK